MLGATDKDIATAYIVGYWGPVRIAHQTKMQSAGPPGTQRFILALVHLKVPLYELVTWHGRAEAPPRPGCLGPPSGSINAMAKPLRGGTLGEPTATAASRRDGIRWWFLVFHHG